MWRFTLFGFPVGVQWMFWLNCALLSGALSAEGPRAIQAVALWIAAAFISILIHELGHAFTMRRYGDRRVSIVLYAFGGLAIPSVRRTQMEDIIVSAAGPMVQIAAGLLVYYTTRSWDAPDWRISYFLGQFFWISVFWGIFNLVPIVPLDGGHILHGFLGPFRRRTTLTVSLACAVLVGLWIFQYTHSIFNLLLFGMLAYNNWQELNGRGQFSFTNMR
ncbi:MAG: M50 family metallopeptidase [Verrucomicrobiales bacterium]|nr:M50 family metallopeptidase [Verrucomicrobiales bacterium]MCP5559267.1 M50 family metallopeptidase [Verrucomicrobiaceae bacterium]